LILCGTAKCWLLCYYHCTIHDIHQNQSTLSLTPNSEFSCQRWCIGW
jgi:hypothetical protein